MPGTSVMPDTSVWAAAGAGSAPGEPRPLLQVANVTIQYKTAQHLVTATSRLTFDVYPGDRFVLLGPSGCGKSSLLKAVGGFIAPVEGEVRLNGRAVSGPGPDRMAVFQEFDQLMPWKTVAQNVAFPLLASRQFGREAAAVRAARYVGKVGLDRFASVYPYMLSGGMKQRVAIARALAMEPAILLMDEPFAALDALTRSRMQQELLALWLETHFTMLFVTHSIEEAITLGSRILVLSPHPGRVRAEFGVRHSCVDGVPATDQAALKRCIQDLVFSGERAGQ